MRTSKRRRAGRGPGPGRPMGRGGPPRRPGRTPGDGLSATLFGLTRQQILGLLFGRPDQAYYVREIARLTGGGLGAVQRELTTLVNVGILERTVRGRQVYYQAARRGLVFEELRSIVAKTSGLAEPLRAALAGLAPSLQAAFIFGSLAADGGSSESDVDLFVIGDSSLGQVVDALADAERQIGREINPVVQSAGEFSRRVAAGDHFVTRLLEGPKLYLIGDADVLGRLGTPRVADAASHESAGNRRAAGARAARSGRQPRARPQR